MSSNNSPSGSRNLFGRQRGRDQEQNSTPEYNLSPDPDIPLPSATSPELREGFRHNFRPKSRKPSLNPALRAKSPTPDLVTSAPLRPPTASLVANPEGFSSKPTIDETKVAQAHSRASQRVSRVCKGLVHLAKRIEPLLEGTPFKTPIAVFTAIAEVVENVKDMNDSADKAFEDLVRLLVIMERAIEETEDSESLTRIDTFVSFLIPEALYVYDIQQKPWWKKTIDIEHYQEMVDGVMTELGQRTKHLFVDISLAVERDTKLIRKLLESIERKEWLRAPTAMYDSDTAKDTPKRGPCTEGTRIEVLERIHAWAADNSPSSPPIFWLSGRAGTGKSTIAYTVCQTSDSSNVHRGLGASFFCSRQVDGLRRLGNIIPTLVYQLAKRSSSFATALRSIDPDTIHNSDKHIGHLLVHPWRASSKDRPDDLSPILLVIDALDEINDDGGPKLLRTLIETMAEVGHSYMRGLKILITSRPHPAIVDMAKSLSRETIYHLEDIGREIGREDVVKFLVNSFPELGTSCPDALEGLADLSNGLFIYAATVVRLITRRDLSPKKRAERISVILREQNARPLRGETRLPIDNIYADIIDESIRIDHSDEISSFRLTALHGILCAFQPLSILELANLISKDSEDVDPEAVRLLVEDLHAVAYISNNRIYTYHKSFSDYLFDEQRCGPEIECKPDASHHVLARGCFRIMTHSLRFNICRLPSSYLFDSEVQELNQSITKNITDVIGLEYACQYWPPHLIKAPTASADHCLLHQLLAFSQSKKVLFWIEVINLLSAKMAYYNGINAVMTWVTKTQRFEGKTELQLVLKAVSRLIKSFLQTPASLSTPHLYISSLAAEFASNSEMPNEWRTGFRGLPHLRFVGISNHGGILTKVYVRSVVRSIAFSAEGQSVVSGSSDKLVRIWHASTGNEVQKLEGHTGDVTSVAFSTDGKRVVSGSEDESVRIWEASTGKEVQKLEGHTGDVTSIAFSPDGRRVVSGSEDKSVRIWDALTGKELKKLHGHTGYVRSVSFSTDGQHIVSGSKDKSVRIWDASTGKEQQKMEGHTDYVTSVAFSADGHYVVSGSKDRLVCIWDASTGEEVQKLEGHTGNVNSVAFSPDGRRVVSGSDDKSVRLWDASAGTELQRLEGHTSSVISVDFSPYGQRIVSGSFDESVCIWDASPGEELQKLEGHALNVNSVAFCAEGQRVVSGSKDESVRIWDASTGKRLRTLEGHTHYVTSVAFSPDGQCVVSGSHDGSVRIWDASTGKKLQTLEGHTHYVNSVAFCPDGQRVVSGSYDRSVRIWDTSTGKELQRLEGHTDPVASVAWSAHQRIVSGSEDKSVRIWDAYTGKELQRLEGHADPVTSVAFSSDGQYIVSGSFDESVCVWDAYTGKEVQKLKGHTGGVTSVAFSPDGQRVVSGSEDKSVRVWDVSTGKERQRLEGHNDYVTSVAFSADGQRVVSGSEDNSVLIWNAFIGKEQYGTEWTAGRDSWLKSKRFDHRLIWLPAHVHPSLCKEPARLVISRERSAVVDFSSACLGSDWAKCYTGSER